MNHQPLNDQPLNDTELDKKIRSLVASAVADTPAPRPLPAREDTAVREIRMSPSRRGFALVGLGAAASLITVAIVWSSNDDQDRVVPATTVSPPTTDAPSTTVPATTVPSWSMPWPTELAVIIASERGIERVTAENGMSVVTSLDEPLVGEVAFETVDGEIISGENLMDVAIIDERLDASRPYADDFQSVERRGLDGTFVQYLQGDFVHAMPRLTHGLDVYVGQSLELDGGYRPLLVRESGLGNDDLLWERLGVDGPFDTGSESPRLFSVSPTGSTIGWVDVDQFVLADGRSHKIPPGSTVVEVDMTDTFVALTRAEGNGLIIDLRTGDAFPVPAAGRLTISLRTAPVAPPTQTLGGIRAVVTQRDVATDTGVWAVGDGSFDQVIPDATGPAFLVGDSIVYSPVAGGVTIRAADGTTSQLRSTGFVQDATLLGGKLFYLYTDIAAGERINLYLHGPGGETYIAVDDWQDTGHTSWHLGRDAIVGTSALYAGLLPAVYDFAGNSLDDVAEAAGPANRDPVRGNMVIYTMSASGLWGSMDGSLLTLRQWGSDLVVESLVVPNYQRVVRIDVEPGRVLVTYAMARGKADVAKLGTKSEDGSWEWEVLPGSGVATLPRTTDPGAPTPPSTTPSAPDPWVALAGDFGVRLIEGENVTEVDTASADRVLLLRNGSMAYRAGVGGYPYLWDRATGQSNELWPAADWIAEPILHDSTFEPGSFLFTVNEQLLEYSSEQRHELAAAPSSRLSYSTNGWVVGERVRYSIGDTRPPAWIGGEGLWALSPNGGLVASCIDGLVQVRRVSDGFVVYERAEDGIDVTEIDLNDEWLSIAETPDDTPNADSTSRVVLVHLASGRMHVYDGAVSASLPDTGI